MIAGYRQFNELLGEAYSINKEEAIEHFRDFITKRYFTWGNFDFFVFLNVFIHLFHYFCYSFCRFRMSFFCTIIKFNYFFIFYVSIFSSGYRALYGNLGITSFFTAIIYNAFYENCFFSLYIIFDTLLTLWMILDDII